MGVRVRSRDVFQGATAADLAWAAVALVKAGKGWVCVRVGDTEQVTLAYNGFRWGRESSLDVRVSIFELS